MGKYDRQTATAKDMLTRYGAPVELVRAVLDYDPVTGAPVASLVLRSECVGVTLPTSKAKASGFDVRLLDVEVTGQIRYWMLGGAAFDPRPDDILRDPSGVLWSVAGGTRLAPDGGKPIYHTTACVLGAAIPATPKTVHLSRWHSDAALAALVANERGTQ